MLDIQFIRDNKELVEKSAKAKNLDVNLEVLLKLDSQRRERLGEIEKLRQERNQLAANTKAAKPSPEQVTKGKELKEKIAKLEKELEPTIRQLDLLLQDIPNVIPDDTPLGGEEVNREEKKWGRPRTDAVQDHLTWAEERDLVDFERGAKVAGNKFYFLKGPLVKLELALSEMAIDVALKYSFIPMLVPHMVSSRVLDATGFAPRGEEKQIYKIQDEDLHLIGTAEIPLTGYHADEILERADLPKLYAGLSPSYRVEAGAYGKHSKGLYRVHQFNKLELYVYCAPEDSEQWHKKILEIEEEICQMLEIPYRVVRIAAGDLGAPAYKKYDIEYWSPPDKTYHELTSCSNVTDYQARRINIKYRTPQGTTDYVHTLNGTAIVLSRVPIALIENHQNKDGSVLIPKTLQKYLGQDKIG